MFFENYDVWMKTVCCRVFRKLKHRSMNSWFLTEYYQKSGNYHKVKIFKVMFFWTCRRKLPIFSPNWIKTWWWRAMNSFYFDYQLITRDNPLLLICLSIARNKKLFYHHFNEKINDVISTGNYQNRIQWPRLSIWANFMQK